MNITTANPITAINSVAPLTKAQPQNGVGDIKATFSQALDARSQTQNSSDTLLRKLAAGENVDLHQVMIAAEQTDIAFRVSLAMRDKLVEAYHEVMRMNV